MVSVIVCGRNDQHGGNIALRASLSLNNLAYLLRPGEDEILFVDWNTPDTDPTFAESLVGFLNDRTLTLLKVIRVRPNDHARFGHCTHLPLLDSVARNVALRRTAAKGNDWIISTTTDTLILPRDQSLETLSDVLSDLPAGFYHCPRYSIPEILWENFKIGDPVAVVDSVRDVASDFWSKEVVTSHPKVLFDGPGDFQLFTLAIARTLQGFDEDLLWSYHTDSNFAVRAYNLLGTVGDVSDRLEVFHCDHYRQSTIHQVDDRLENDPATAYINLPSTHTAANINRDWGLADTKLEMFNLVNERPSRQIKAGLRAAIGTRQPDEPITTVIDSETFNTLTYPLEHILPFIANHLAPLPPTAPVYVSSIGDTLFDRLNILLKQAGRPDAKRLNETISPPSRSILIFDFGFASARSRPPSTRAIDHLEPVVASYLRTVVDLKHDDFWVIALNAIHTVFERLTQETLAPIRTPYTQRVRFGHPRSGDARVGLGFPDIEGTSEAVSGSINPTRRVDKSETAAAIIAVKALFKDLQPNWHRTTLSACMALLETERMNIRADRLATIRDAIGTRQVNTEPPLACTIDRASTLPGPCLSGYAEAGDWEAPKWQAALSKVWELSTSRNVFERDRAVWDAGQHLFALSEIGRPSHADTVLLFMRRPHVIAGPLSWASRSLILSAPKGPVSTQILNGINIPMKRAGLYWDDGQKKGSIAVVTTGALKSTSVDELIGDLAGIGARLESNAILSVMVDVDIAAECSSNDFLRHSDLCNETFPSLLKQRANLEFLGDHAPRFSISALTAERLLPTQSGKTHSKQLGTILDGGAVIISAHLFLRKLEPRRVSQHSESESIP